MTAFAFAPKDYWRDRLHIPAYGVTEAARFARTSPQTVREWHKPKGNRAEPTLHRRESGEKLSYLQLIEVGVVAAMRQAGLTLQTIRKARSLVSERLSSQHPFAEHRFKHDGKNIFLDLEHHLGLPGRNKLIDTRNGQLVWKNIIEQILSEFEYGENDFVLRWHLFGGPVTIDPRVSFGEPCISGVPIWIIVSRLKAGETHEEISDDFDLNQDLIRVAVRVAGYEPEGLMNAAWLH